MEHYLDNAATTMPCVAAADAMLGCIRSAYGNPSSLHRKGLEAQHQVDGARKAIADALGAKPQEILFTSGATESNNLALRGVMAAHGRRRKTIVASAVEHASIRQTLAHLEQQGYRVITVPPRADGTYYPADFLAAVNEDTCLVTMMLVNNENGYRLPVAEVFRAVKRRDPEIFTHCDAVQGFLKVPLRARTLGADLISLSAHKVHGAKGVGALYMRQGVRISPILFGGHQERSLRPGTECVPLIAAFGAAVETLSPTIEARYAAVSALRQTLIDQLGALDDVLIRDIPGASPYVLSISLPGYRSETVLHDLERRGVYVSSGSACSKGASSGVLEAFGATPQEVDSALRISFCADNTKDDVMALVAGLQAAQQTLIHKPSI